MNEVKINKVRVKSAQALLYRNEYMASGRSAGIRIVACGKIDFAGDDHFVTAVFYQFSPNLFSFTPIIDVRAVEEIDPGFATTGKKFFRCFRIGITAE